MKTSSEQEEQRGIMTAMVKKEPTTITHKENREYSKVLEIRKAAGLTQQALAEKAGVNFRWIQKLESKEIDVNNITLKNAIAISDALGIEPRDLL